MGNEFTKQSIRTWLEDEIKKSKDPDPKEKQRRKRQERMKKVANKYGL